MGRTYRGKDKKFKKKLKEGRRVKQNKRTTWSGEHSDGRTEDRKKKDSLESYLFT